MLPIRCVSSSTCGKFFEFHLVTGESACFIWEDIFYLAEFFIEIRALDFGFDAVDVVDHFRGPLYEQALVDFYYVYSY